MNDSMNTNKTTAQEEKNMYNNNKVRLLECLEWNEENATEILD